MPILVVIFFYKDLFYIIEEGSMAPEPQDWDLSQYKWFDTDPHFLPFPLSSYVI